MLADKFMLYKNLGIHVFLMYGQPQSELLSDITEASRQADLLILYIWCCLSSEAICPLYLVHRKEPLIELCWKDPLFLSLLMIINLQCSISFKHQYSFLPNFLLLPGSYLLLKKNRPLRKPSKFCLINEIMNFSWAFCLLFVINA